MHLIANMDPVPGRRHNPYPWMELDRIENDLMKVLTKPKIQPNQDGLVEVPNRPGLGVEIDENVLQKYILRS